MTDDDRDDTHDQTDSDKYQTIPGTESKLLHLSSNGNDGLLFYESTSADRLATVTPAVIQIDVAIMDGREVPGFWLDAGIKRYRALRAWHFGELFCLDDHWLDANGFSGIIDAGLTRHCVILNGHPREPIKPRSLMTRDLAEMIGDLETRARACGLERRWFPTAEGPVFADGDPVLAPANADEAELAVAAQPRVLVALAGKVRELLAFVAKVDYASPDLRRPRDGDGYDNARMELDLDVARLRRIELP